MAVICINYGGELHKGMPGHMVSLTHPQWPARTCGGWTAAGPGRASGCSA